MISVIPGRRRADEFARAVEAAHRSRSGSEDADLLEVVAAMRGVEAPEPRPEFVTSLRAQLMAEADVALSDIDARLSLPSHPRSGRDRRLALAAGTLAVVAGTGSVAFAAQGALPGDTLYPVKRVLEGAETSLAVGDAAKATQALENATGRLDEIERLAARIDAEDSASAQAALPQSLDDFSRQAEEAAELKIAQHDQTGDNGPITELRDFTADGIDKLSLLDGVLPDDALGSLRDAVRTLTGIEDRAAALCPQCGDVLQIPQNLLVALQASTSAPDQVAPTTLQDLLKSTPVQRGNDHPQLPTVDPQDLGPANVGGPGTKQKDDAPTQKDGPLPVDVGGDGSVGDAGKKAVKDIENTVKKGGRTLLGKDGVLRGDNGALSPLNPLLDPLLDPLVGDNGLLGR